jgi:hypothetical protein
MAADFPLQFTLESGTDVTINRIDQHHFDFVLKPEEEAESHFSYDHSVTFTPEMEEKLTFDQLNALRRFWLEMEKEDLE